MNYHSLGVLNFMEIWKQINGFPQYEISMLGNVKKNGKLLNVGINQSGYYRINLYIGRKAYTNTIHRLIALHFIPNPNNYPILNHIDGNKLNNSLDNLEWCTYSHNTQHAYDNKLMKAKSCELHGRSKLTKENVSGIRSGKYTERQVKDLFNLSRTQFYRIKRNEGWAF